MKYQTLGIIGSGNHFNNKIKPVLKKNKFFKISGYLKRKNLKKNYFTEKEFFKKKFDFVYISCPNELHEKYIVKASILEEKKLVDETLSRLKWSVRRYLFYE